MFKAEDSWLYHNCGVPGCPQHDIHHALDYDWIKQNHSMIHYFGLGFIQVKLSSKTRVHFYVAELPSIVPEEDIHNHRYGFKSHIMKGELRQEIFATDFEYNFGEKKDYLLTAESCNPSFQAPLLQVPCRIKLLSSSNYSQGSSYVLDHKTYHRVSSDFAVTFLHRGPYEKEFAHVVKFKDSPEICPFSHKVDEAELWRIIKKIL